MTAVIHLDIVLREAVEAPYRDLVTRPTGAAVRSRVLGVLRDAPGGDAQLDFSGVGLVDFSCADEVVAKLLQESQAMPIARVVLRGVHDHHADAIEHALARHDLVVVAVFVDTVRPRLLGAVADDWRDAFGALDQLGRTTADRVAASLTWPEPRAAAALGGLARRRCVLAHPDATFESGAVA